jgi:hypothetical protein
MAEVNNNGNAATSVLWKDPTFLWSLDFRTSASFENLYGSQVKAGVLAAAAKHRQTLSPKTIEWLGTHHGHYEMYMHPEAKATQQKLDAPQYRSVPRPTVQQQVLSNEHCIIHPSPRFASTNLSFTSQNNYERMLRNFWWFLCIIGDYDSMLILLADPPNFVPSCSPVNQGAHAPKWINAPC